MKTAAKELTREQVMEKAAKSMGFKNIKEYELEARKQYAMVDLRYKLREDPRYVTDRVGEWSLLYAKYPNLIESSKLFEEGKSPNWYTDEMNDLLKDGATPIEAYEATQGIVGDAKKEIDNDTAAQIADIRQDIQRVESILDALHEKMQRLKHESDLLKVCPYCGNAFRAVGRKKYCNDNCRVNDFYKQKKMKGEKECQV